MNSNIKMTNKFAYITSGVFFIILNDEEIGFRCSEEAFENIKQGSWNCDVYTVEIDDEIVWISEKEFKKYNFNEREIKRSEFRGIQN